MPKPPPQKQLVDRISEVVAAVVLLGLVAILAVGGIMVKAAVWVWALKHVQ